MTTFFTRAEVTEAAMLIKESDGVTADQASRSALRECFGANGNEIWGASQVANEMGFAGHGCTVNLFEKIADQVAQDVRRAEAEARRQHSEKVREIIFRTFRLKADFGFLCFGSCLKQNIDGNYFVAQSDEQVIANSMPWIGGVTLKKEYVESDMQGVLVEV